MKAVRNPDYKFWLTKELWRVSEFVLLACGFDPDIDEGDEQVVHLRDDDSQEWVRTIFEPCAVLQDSLRRAVATEKISVNEYNPDFPDAARPIVFLRWAVIAGVQLPPKLVEYEKEHPIVQDGNPSAMSKGHLRKMRTSNKHELWRNEYLRLRKLHPDKSKVWISLQIHRTIAPQNSPETIRKQMIR
jgi:hypothetical protein